MILRLLVINRCCDNDFHAEIELPTHAEFYSLRHNHVDLGLDLVGHQIATLAGAADTVCRLPFLPGINHPLDLLHVHE